MKHPIKIEGFENLEDLAKAVGNLRFDALDDFLRNLAEDLNKQADADKERGRINLANSLYDAASNVSSAREKITEAWKISEPYMRDSAK